MQTKVEDCRIIDFPRFSSPTGAVCPIESGVDLPYSIERIFYLYDIPCGGERSRHAHRELHQTLVSLIGSFDVQVDDGTEKKQFSLNRSHYGLYIPPRMWTELSNFSSGAVCLVLSSDVYKDSDYIRDYEEFLKLKQQQHAHIK